MTRSKGWSNITRRNARKFSGLLKMMAHPPEWHLTREFGAEDISPRVVTGALAQCRNRRDLNGKMSWGWLWRSRLEKRGDLWPSELTEGLWDEIWGIYRHFYSRLPGDEAELQRKA